jgi:hypothetical protein
MRASVVRTVLAATAVAAAGVVCLAPTAQAGSCTTGLTGTGGWARCTGYPAFNVYLTCYNSTLGWPYTVQGPTVGSGATSRANCSFPDVPQEALAQLGGGGGVE